MRTGRLLFLYAVLLAAGLFYLQPATSRDLTQPEATTKSFYLWYIHLQSKLIYPLLDDGIYKYVARETVRRLRDDYHHSRLPGDTDYFMKVQDYDEDDWASHIAIHAPLMLGDLVIVPVTFGSKDKVSVLVFLRKQDDTWKITRVEDTLDHP
jgi:hypothetical protein